MLEERRIESGAPTASRHLLGGLSLSGLQAAFTALRFPDRFDRVLCQSASFSWEEERLARDVLRGDFEGGHSTDGWKPDLLNGMRALLGDGAQRP